MTGVFLCLSCLIALVSGVAGAATINIPTNSVTIKEDTAITGIPFSVVSTNSSLTVTPSFTPGSPALEHSPTFLVMHVSGTNYSLSITPQHNDYGEGTVTISVLDPDGADQDAFDLSVLSVPDTPTISGTVVVAVNDNVATQLFADIEIDDGDTSEISHNLGYKPHVYVYGEDSTDDEFDLVNGYNIFIGWKFKVDNNKLYINNFTGTDDREARYFIFYDNAFT